MSSVNDTSAEAYAVQLELMRKMPPEQRVQKAIVWSGQLKRMAMDAIRRRHPGFDDQEVRLKFIEVTYGKELADDVRRSYEERDNR